MNLLNPRTDEHFYVSIIYLILNIANIFVTTRKNTRLMHFSFGFMIVLLPLRLLGFENTREMMGEKQWMIQLVIVTIASFWNLI